MTDKKIEVLLEESVLPALLNMIEITGSMSEQQSKSNIQVLETIKKTMMPSEWRTMLIAVDKRLKGDKELSDVIRTLAERVGETNKSLSDLVISTNALVTLQTTQNALLEQVKDSFEENTARLNVLTVAVSKSTHDKPLEALYDTLRASQ